MWVFQLSLSSMVRPRYRHEWERATDTLSTFKGKDGRVRLEEKAMKTDFKPLKVSLAERPHATAESHIA